MSEPADFPQLMEKVARRLLGEPNKALSNCTTLRWGNKGSLRVKVDEGFWDDFEGEIGGGTIDLVMRERRCDKARAVAWLEDEGLIPKRDEPTFYDYRDENGVLRYRVERTSRGGQRFVQHGPDGCGGFHSRTGCMKGVKPLPYRLPELLAADPAAIVYVCEGEKDVDRLRAHGLVATTNSGGSGQWRPELDQWLAGRLCVLLEDNDDAGRKRCARLSGRLSKIAARMAVLRLSCLPEHGDVSDWLDQGHAIAELQRLAEEALEAPEKFVAADSEPAAEPPKSETAAISATPFCWRDPATIPPRPWVYGRWFLRCTVTNIVAPGGTGKSSLMASTILSMAIGRELLGKTVWGGPQRVWYWNLEDDGDEIDRWIHAAAILHGINAAEIGDRLFVDSAMDGSELCTATEDAGEFKILRPVVEALVAELIRRQIDVLIIDPFVSSHAVDENRNTFIDKIAKEWGRVAKRANCSIGLVHHTRKSAGQKVTAEMSRGAVALIYAGRQALVLNRMDEAEAQRFGIEGDKERRRYFTVQDDKHNRAPAEDAEWYRIASVDLGNGDDIGVVERWSPPDAFEGVRPDHLYRVQCGIQSGEWLENHQAKEWAGHVVADALGLDPQKDRKRIIAMLRAWVANDALRVIYRQDKAKGRERPFIVVGRWQNDPSPPEFGGVGGGGAVGQTSFPTTTPPLKGVGGGVGAPTGDEEVGQAPAGHAPSDCPHFHPGVILAPGECHCDPVAGVPMTMKGE